MDSFEDDMFALSDDDVLQLTPKCNPVEEHLIKQLSNVQFRIEKAKNDIQEIRSTTQHVLKSLHSQALYGETASSDSESDLYTIEGQPVVKKKKQESIKHIQALIVKDVWKHILCEKWIIGIVLCNTSTETLCNLGFYVNVKGEAEIHGVSSFWNLENEIFWCRTDIIPPRDEAVATVALDLPNFDTKSRGEVYGTIVYQMEEKEYQTPTPTMSLSVEETVNSGLKFSDDVQQNILAIKCTSVEKIVGIKLEGNPEKGALLLEFLSSTNFREIADDVYVVKMAGSLMYCLVEILPLADDEAKIKISARSSSQMKVILRLLQNQFPDLIMKENNHCVEAATALIQELELYLRDGSAPEIQRARIKTDLLIP